MILKMRRTHQEYKIQQELIPFGFPFIYLDGSNFHVEGSYSCLTLLEAIGCSALMMKGLGSGRLNSECNKNEVFERHLIICSV